MSNLTDDPVIVLQHDAVAVLFSAGDQLKSSIAECNDTETLGESYACLGDAAKRIAERREEIKAKLIESARRKLLVNADLTA